MENQWHYLDICPVVEDIRIQYDIESDLNLIGFFTAVLERRNELEDS